MKLFNLIAVAALVEAHRHHHSHNSKHAQHHSHKSWEKEFLQIGLASTADLKETVM